MNFLSNITVILAVTEHAILIIPLNADFLFIRLKFNFIFQKTFGDFMARGFMAGDFLAGNFMAHRVTFGDFMAGNFLARDFLG